MTNTNIYSKDYIVNLFNDKKALNFIKGTKKFDKTSKYWSKDLIEYMKNNKKSDILDFYNNTKPKELSIGVITYLEKNPSFVEDAKKVVDLIAHFTNRQIGNLNNRDIWRFLIVDHFYNTYYDDYLFKEKAQLEIKKHVGSKCFLSNTLSENKEKFGKAPVIATKKQLADLNIKAIVYSKNTEKPICAIQILHNNEYKSFDVETYFKRMCIENNLSALPLVFIKANKNGYVKSENFETLDSIIDDYHNKKNIVKDLIKEKDKQNDIQNNLNNKTINDDKISEEKQKMPLKQKKSKLRAVDNDEVKDFVKENFNDNKVKRYR